MAQPRSTGRSRIRIGAWVVLSVGATMAVGAAGAPALGSATAGAAYQGTPVTASTGIRSAPQVSSGVHVVDVSAAGGTGCLEVRRSMDGGSNVWVGATMDLGMPAQVATFDSDRDQDGSSATSSDGDDVPWPIVLMLFGGGAIFGVVGVVALSRVRRGRP